MLTPPARIGISRSDVQPLHRTRFEDPTMPASEARIRANRANALLSTGPKTPEGKERSRQNGLKHGLTGEGIVIPQEDVAEVERRQSAFRAEREPSGEVGEVLLRRLAVLSVRMDRCVDQEIAAIAENVAKAMAEFEVPEGVDEATADRLRALEADRAKFDPSKEACLARKYEAAAERGFFRALKELRQVEREAKAEIAAPATRPAPEALGSSLNVEKLASILQTLPGETARIMTPTPSEPSKRVAPARNPGDLGSFYVPIAIGRRG
jgi:hypothetical protein